MAVMAPFKPLLPIVFWLLLNAVTGVSLAIPLKRRWVTLPFVLLPAYLSFSTINLLTLIPGLDAIWGTITMIGLVHFLALLYIKKWTLRPDEFKDKVRRTGHTWLTTRSWKKMYKISSNPRMIGVTDKEVMTPAKVVKIKSMAIHQPFSRRSIIRLLLMINFQFFVLGPLFPGPFMPLTKHDFSQERRIFLRRVLWPGVFMTYNSISVREVMLRMAITLYSNWMTVFIMELLHTIPAIVMVWILGVDTPEEWSDLFGSPREAYTLGRFWSRFWHRIHLSGYVDVAGILINVLPKRLIRNTRTRTVISTFLLFSFSGVIHMLIAWQLENHCGITNDFWYFIANGVAVILEDMVLGFFRPSLIRRASDIRIGSMLPTVLLRVSGYVWVFGFMFWCLPKIYYPKLYCQLS